MSLNSWVFQGYLRNSKNDFSGCTTPSGISQPPFDARQQDSPLAEWFSAITRGERILLHCAAGLGRTGTVAAGLLMLAGQSADSAIKQVRTARPGTVESASQEQFLRNPS
ncbi:MAG: tyrosine-protein phosphatase [Arenicellales bacterium]